MNAEQIKNVLLVDEHKVQAEQLQRVGAHLRLDTRGRVHIHDPTHYKQRDCVLLYLIGVKYATEAGLRDADTVGLAELSESLGTDSAGLASRLAELRNEGKVESPARGEYRVVFPRLPWILNQIDSSKVKNE